MLFRYELATNDPDLPVITLTLTALVAPISQFVRRIEDADVIKGDFIGAFKVWPTAHPRITLAQGETLSFSLRIWPDQPIIAQVTSPDSPAVGVSQPQDSSKAADASKVSPLPRGALSATVRPGSTGQTYWLDVKIGPVKSPGSFRSPIAIPPGYKKLSALISLDVFVVVRGQLGCRSMDAGAAESLLKDLAMDARFLAR